MRTARRLLTVLGLTAAAVLAAAPGPASAHPLGNFTVNAYSGITVRPGAVRVDYVLDLAEIPTFQERSTIDLDDDGVLEAAERSAWAVRRAQQIAAGLSLEVNSRPLRLSLEGAAASLLPGQAGLDVLRLEARYGAVLPRAGTAVFRDANNGGRIGWREIIAVGSDGAAVRSSSVPAVSVSDALRVYPDDLQFRPLTVRTATFVFGPGEDAGPVGGPSSVNDDGGSSMDALAAMVGRPSLSPAAALLALLAAFGVGMLHALAPGHGKTLAAAYLAGGGGTVRQAIATGVAVSLMHTVSVAAAVAVILRASEAFPAERLYPWLGLAAGLTAMGLGGALLVARVRGRGHAHAHPPSRRGLLAVALSGGMLPSPSALVVLLAAVTLGRVALGLGLIAAFAVGLAAAIAGVGVLAVQARDAVARRSWGRVAGLLPIGSAAVILVMGVVLTGRAVVQL